VLELGHRGQPTPDLTYSATVFRQYYKGLRAGIPGAVPALVENQIEGPSKGIEAWGEWKVNPDWRLSAGYLRQYKNLRFSSGASDLTSKPKLGNDPSYQKSLRSRVNIGPRGEFDVSVRRVGGLPSPFVPAYTAVDARLAWRLTPTFELSLMGENLFDRRHVEFGAAGVASQIERRVVVKAVWQL
jgi:iron complex outermembrane recepter protein